MDEEELEQPSSKINLGSFFERVDSVEKVANNALSRANANLGLISNQKLIINSLSVTIEAMETKIRDIANYIIIEKKLEKDVEEDRALEEQDRLQKQAMVERATTIMGEPGPQGEPGSPAEQQGGGSSLLGTLLKLGIGAFTLKFIWPAILPLAGGLLKGALAKFAIFSIGGLGGLIKAMLVGSGLTGLGFGIGALFEKFANKTDDSFKKAGESAAKKIEEFKFNEKGEVSGGEGTLEVEGGEVSGGEGTLEVEGGEEVEKENLVNGDESMKNTLIKKDLIKGKPIRNRRGRIIGYEKVEKETSESTYKSGENPEKDNLIKLLVKEEEKKEKELEAAADEDFNTVNSELETISEAIDNLKFNEKENEFGGYDYLQNFLKEQNIKVEGNKEPFATDKVEPVDNQSKIEVETKNKNLDLSSDNIEGDMTQAIAKTNERIDNLIGAENKEQNNGNLVSANKPNVTEATLKLAAAPLPFVKVIKNNQLSTSPKSYNGLPPEIAAMIS